MEENIKIKDLNKTQLVWLVLLICFVVSMATGVVTVSLMQQVPKSVPQIIHQVIQRTIDNVTTVAPTKTDTEATPILGNGDVLVDIYSPGTVFPATPDTTSTTAETPTVSAQPTPLGQGVIISDVGLILVENSILSLGDTYSLKLAGTPFQAKIIKKFGNGFSILKIVTAEDKTTAKPDTGTGATTTAPIDTKL